MGMAVTAGMPGRAVGLLLGVGFLPLGCMLRCAGGILVGMSNLSSRHKKNGDDPEHPGVFQTELHRIGLIGELGYLVNRKTKKRSQALASAQLHSVNSAGHLNEGFSHTG